MLFDTGAVSRWAHFSNDFNAIHFDLERARLLGVDSLIVHGMLAALTVKQKVSHAVSEDRSQPASWLRFRTLFRAPVLQDETLSLAIRSRKEGFQFALKPARQESEEALRGTLGPATEGRPVPTGRGGEFGRCSISSDDLQRLGDFYPGSMPTWVALDALVFSGFMRSETVSFWRLLEEHALPRLGRFADPPLVVHSGQTIWFQSDQLDVVSRGGAIWSAPLSCQVMAIDVEPFASDTRKTLAITVTIEVSSADETLMIVDHGIYMIAPIGADYMLE